MRWLAFASVSVATAWGLLFGCGQSEGGTGAAANAGSPAGGSSIAHAGTEASAGKAGGSSSAGTEGGAPSSLVECDPHQVLCKRTPPECPTGEVPSVDGTCYGDCVKIELCTCSAAEQCPQPAQYTCWAQQHCGPFVE